jgi:pSer/pThr/pTyr-binding forkhead associated (FHA) protein
MKLQLTSLFPWTAELHIEVNNLPAVIGRDSRADVRLDDHFVSRVHCEISDLNGTPVVRDLGSKHGTFVNGVKVNEAPLLRGDRLTVGVTSLSVDYQRPQKEESGSNLAGTASG